MGGKNARYVTRHEAQLMGIDKLSELCIDESKDWGGFKITNVGSPEAAADVVRVQDVATLAPTCTKGWHVSGSLWAGSVSVALTTSAKDIDLSGIVGTGSVLVMLRVEAVGATEAFIARQKGDSTIQVYSSDVGHAAAGYTAAGGAAVLMAVTDKDGIVEILTDSGDANAKIYVLGWVD